MMYKILKKATSELEVIELATINGFDQGAIDKLVIQWNLEQKVKVNKKSVKINS